MRIAFISPWYPANFNRWLADAFEILGHEVIRYGDCFPKHYDVNWKHGTDYMKAVRPIERGFQLRDFDCDLLVLNDWPELVIHGTGRECKFALLEPEGWGWSWRRRDILRPDAAFCAMPYGVLDDPYPGPGGSALDDGWHYLPGACHPPVHPYLFCQRDMDFIMLANLYNYRHPLCDYLREKCLQVIEGQSPIEVYAHLHNRTLATCESSEGQGFIKWRFFEAMAMGCAVIATPCPLADLLGFVPLEHYYLVPARPAEHRHPKRTEPEFEAVFQAILRMREKPDEWGEITDRARMFVLGNHTYLHRAKQILGTVG